MDVIPSKIGVLLLSLIPTNLRLLVLNSLSFTIKNSHSGALPIILFSPLAPTKPAIFVPCPNSSLEGTTHRYLILE